MSSESLRNEGNTSYRRAMDPGLAPVLKRARLDEALGLYAKAAACARSPAETASATKNRALMHRHLAILVLESGVRPDGGGIRDAELIQARRYMMEAMIGLVEAGKAAGQHKAYAWHDGLVTIALELTTSYTNMLQAQLRTFEARIPQLEQLIYNHRIGGCFPCVRVLLCRAVAEMYFKEGVTAKESGDFRFGLHCVNEAERPLIEGRDSCRLLSAPTIERLVADDANEEKPWCYELADVETDLRILNDDLRSEGFTLRAVQSIFVGDQFIGMALSSDDHLITGYVYDAIDLFRDAIVCSRGHDLKAEAVAYSRLGGVYTDILKRPQFGKQQYQRCIEIALALSPGVDHNVDWYKKAWEAVKEQQDRLTRLIEDEWTVEREPFEEEMKPVLDEISEAADGPPKDLLEHVYEAHPPKNESHTGPAEYDEDTNYKSLLRRALIHYHFDNNRAKYNDTKWSMICEEISKNLSAQYEKFK